MDRSLDDNIKQLAFAILIQLLVIAAFHPYGNFEQMPDDDVAFFVRVGGVETTRRRRYFSVELQLPGSRAHKLGS